MRTALYLFACVAALVSANGKDNETQQLPPQQQAPQGYGVQDRSGGPYMGYAPYLMPPPYYPGPQMFKRDNIPKDGSNTPQQPSVDSGSSKNMGPPERMPMPMPRRGGAGDMYGPEDEGMFGGPEIMGRDGGPELEGRSGGYEDPAMEGRSGMDFGEDPAMEGRSGMDFGEDPEMEGRSGMDFGEDPEMEGRSGMDFGEDPEMEGRSGMDFGDDGAGDMDYPPTDPGASGRGMEPEMYKRSYIPGYAQEFHQGDLHKRQFDEEDNGGRSGFEDESEQEGLYKRQYEPEEEDDFAGRSGFEGEDESEEGMDGRSGLGPEDDMEGRSGPEEEDPELEKRQYFENENVEGRSADPNAECGCSECLSKRDEIPGEKTEDRSGLADEEDPELHKRLFVRRRVVRRVVRRPIRRYGFNYRSYFPSSYYRYPSRIYYPNTYRRYGAYRFRRTVYPTRRVAVRRTIRRF
ncbi:hypothetical protein MP638_004987 [Amoeboaphelidium occidentale]|nr:hypothetical protein MP638_004987 [Amoeboaphelidium occidentale]